MARKKKAEAEAGIEILNYTTPCDGTRDEVRDSLIQQLAVKGASIACFTDLVEDYLKFWDIKNALQNDIKARGVVYSDVSSVGVMMMKNNPSIKEIVSVNRQMLAILKELNLSTDKAGETDDEEL